MVITDKFQYIVPVAVMMLEGFLWFDYFYATYIDLHIIWYHNGIHINHPFSITIDDGMKWIMKYPNHRRWLNTKIDRSFVRRLQ